MKTRFLKKKMAVRATEALTTPRFCAYLLQMNFFLDKGIVKSQPLHHEDVSG